MVRAARERLDADVAALQDTVARLGDIEAARDRIAECFGAYTDQFAWIKDFCGRCTAAFELDDLPGMIRARDELTRAYRDRKDLEAPKIRPIGADGLRTVQGTL